MKRLPIILSTLALTGVLASSEASAQVSRTEALDRAKAYAYYPWTASSANVDGTCSSSYVPMYTPGDYMGMAYRWGGFDSLFGFTEKLNDGYAAGKHAGGDVLSCTTGIDCSGFVSRTWRTNSKYGTATFEQISSSISVSNLLVGDSFNDAGNHGAFYSHTLGNGEPFMYEAVFHNTRVNANGGWSWVDGFVPIRYQSISGTSASNPVGTLNTPIQVTSFPFADTRNTVSAPSDLLDGCGASPNTNETGPEYVYELHIPSPGQLTVSVSDDVGVDIDVHLFETFNTNDCVARNDATFTQSVDCGTYYVVADTFAGFHNAGSFDLNIEFTPDGNSCGDGPKQYDFEGTLGADCAYPGNPALPECNPSFGAETCIYTSGADSTSFCSKSCATAADCEGMPGACCEDIGANEFYCLAAELCSADPGGEDPNDPGSQDPNDPGNEDPNDPGNEDPNDPGNGSGSGDGSDGSGDGGQSGGCSLGGGSSSSTTGGLLLMLGALLSIRRRRRS